MTRSAIRWPAEWERHRGTLMAWPHDPDTWPGAFDAIPDQYERLVREIARFEPVWLLAGNETAVQQAQQRFGGEHRLGQGNQIQDNQITVCDIPTNDVWTRDYGPTVVLDVEAGTRLAVDWIYNGWGGKYPQFDRDAAVARTFASRLELPICRPQVVLEGGAIEGNGQGTVLTTRSCLLNPNRNPGLSESQVTGLLRQNLGASTVVWLDGGDFSGDDTDGHIDQLARFTSESHIIYASCSEDDVNRPTLEQLERQLEQRLPNTDRIPIPVRDDLQLTSGRAKMKIRGGTEPHERLTGEVSLSDVSARGRQQEMRWEQPVLLSVDIRRDQGLQVENLHLDSDFLVARLNGSLKSGNGTVSGDLGKLHHELSRWLDLPVTNMGGQLTGELHWELDGDQVVGRGELDVLDALVKRTDETPWSDARVHVDWKSVALLSETSTPALQSADFVLQTSTQDRIEWHARQSDAGLAWSGDALIKLEHLPRAELADGTGTTIIEGTLIGDIEGTTVDKAYNITTVNATIDQLHIRGENVLVREPTVIFRASGSVEKEQGVAHLDQFEFTSTTVAFGGKNLLVDWRDQLSVKFDAATRADLSKLDRWIPASQSDLYRWEGEFVGNVALELALAETSVSWSGSVDKFAMRRAPVGGVSGGLAGLNDTIWREAKLTSKGQLTFEFETQSLLVDVSATSDAVELSLAGEVRDISTTPFAALKGEIGYDYKHLQPNLQLLLGRSVKITGKGRQPIRLNGPVFVDSTEDPMDRPVVNSKLEAEAGVDWVSASGYGVNVGAGQLHAKLSGAVVSFTPLDFPLANGRLHAEPWVDLRSAPGRVFLKPGPVMEKVNITPDMCRTWIRFAAPLLANATRAEGQLTAQLDHAELPLGNPESASALGTLQIHEGRAGAGPLVREILALAGQMQSIIRKQPVNLGQSKLDWVTLPPQEIDFRLSEGAVYHQRFEMRVKDIHLVTSGTVYLDNDQTIDLICEVPVQDEWLKSNRLLSSLRGTTLRIPVTGTLSKPKINRQILGDLGKKMLRGATENLLRDQLERGLRDLFK